LPPVDVQAPALALARLDAAAQPLARACRRLLADPSTAVEPGRPDPDIAARLAELEASLSRRFAAELALPGWHGPTSCQRLVWQDAEVLELLAAPEVAREVLVASAAGPSRPAGPANLAGALVGGLAVNRPSYLFGACPNWAALPAIAGLQIDALDDMRPPTAACQATPFQVSGRLVAAAGRASRAFAGQLLIATVATDTGAALWAAIGAAPAGRLAASLASLLDAARLEALVHDPAVASTSVARMRGQCLEVLSSLPAIRLAEDLETTLGFGLVSHALDAKHLAAMLGGAREPDRRPAAARFDRLIEDLAMGRMGPIPTALFTARLRQAMQLVADGARRLALSPDEILRSLDP
jgi:hypothetical protein